ncbi:head GIN domain-containing protein [Fulvivirga sedimenti]|uniref:DUF2807 domain-containing protein n=1 Tax=Fulvivirga sedimenti TaxID=2879465 RepID=A0A9X1KYW4_9BACT|nr:head GIN domain-containing protein [Fulvivirga sedimenti]MCA6074041.1 DUF2807 domain-containing protein [Fulvivirga sedimenti]
MKSTHILFTAFILMLGFAVSVQAQDRRKVNVSGFEGVNLGGSGNVYIKQGSAFSVEFSGSDEVFEEMKFDVRGNTLNIGRKGNSWWNSSKGRYEIYITMPNINRLGVSGSGNMEVEGTFKTDDLDISVSGSGEVRFGANAGDVDISVSGSGEVEMTGTGRNLTCHISGSGKVDGRDFKVANVDAHISGSGSVYIHASESIESRISGSGSVYYSGEPKKLNNNSSGSGKIRKID